MSPTNSDHLINIHLNSEVYDLFQTFCKQYECSESEAMEIALRFLLEKIQCHLPQEKSDQGKEAELTTGSEQLPETGNRLTELVDQLLNQVEEMDQLLALKRKVTQKT